MVIMQSETTGTRGAGDEAILSPGVQSDFAGGVLTLSLSGDIDHHSAGLLRQTVDRELYFYRPKTVRMKLGDVDFMDSSGLGFFMGRYQLSRTLGCTFVLVDPPPRVMRILELSGMDRRLNIEKIYHAPKKEGSMHHGSGEAGEKTDLESVAL